MLPQHPNTPPHAPPISVYRDPRPGKAFLLSPTLWPHSSHFKLDHFFSAIKLYEKKLLPFPVNLLCTIKKSGPKKVAGWERQLSR